MYTRIESQWSMKSQLIGRRCVIDGGIGREQEEQRGSIHFSVLASTILSTLDANAEMPCAEYLAQVYIISKHIISIRVALSYNQEAKWLSGKILASGAGDPGSIPGFARHLFLF